ncbi:hypothetical protein K461DRAFT_271906 [Myriangium duriaei CBS 260.36]|uniref:CNH domain-containing protein n=1 Tax=Myriangium duriaei CBS 260.36 TaxID=1168546 RepID=A0A9P4IU31_9PEZI|nr:hypothetical protein K461DRAFT_271906 [Myriangium duriaei CBS 260.36]
MSEKALPKRPKSLSLSSRPGSDSPYAFQDLLRDVPLSADDEGNKPQITCVDFWDGNLYVGASNGELLHFVSIPAESETEPPTFILASRLEPLYNAPPDPTNLSGVQRILVLPSVKKACVICNGTLTFYTLPELSPAYGGIKQGDCLWVGGLDEDRTYEEDEEVIVVLCLRSRLRLIRIGQQARKVRDIELPGCVSVRRRGDLACVADERAYSLLDVVNQRKNELFPISSRPVSPPRTPSASDWPSPYQSPRSSTDEPRPRPSSMHIPSSHPAPHIAGRGHERISSMGAQPRNTDRLTSEGPWPSRGSSRLSTDGHDSPARSRSPLAVRAAENAMRPSSPNPPALPPDPPVPAEPLKPIILSPTPHEFLLTTGTGLVEPGVGMFVNQDGDVSRGTVEFSTYPKALVIDGQANEDTSEQPGSQSTETYLIALTSGDDEHSWTLELQPIDGEEHQKSTLQLPKQEKGNHVRPSISQSTSQTIISTPGMVKSLGQRRLGFPTTTEDVADKKRAEQEDRLIERFATNTARCIFFSGDGIWWLVRHPILIKLDSRLDGAVRTTASSGLFSVQRQEAEHVFNDLRGREPQDEIQFMTFNYVRQKASVLLLLDLMIKTAQGVNASDRDLKYTQDALISSDVEPRVILSLIPLLKGEIVEGPNGIWVPGGLKTLLETILENQQIQSLDHESSPTYWTNIFPVIKTLLMSWRKKKGFGSISDEEYVFKTVDAALVHVLLFLDQRSPSGPATAGTLRAELNEVMDRGVDCFDRAVTLLESFHRLYVLSRLYQNKKMSSLVLATWRRILDGEEDLGGELVDGESDVRKYLGRIKDAALVREYGTWLANRNPSLGVQIFADDNSRVKFSTTEAVDLLKAKAPNAVKYYLEYLVFAKQQPQYSEDLINFYLDSLLSTISTPDSPAASTLESSYDIYTALPPPKPTYMSFITLNSPDEEWHHSRLRLLQLLESTPLSSTLDMTSLTSRLSPYTSLLIPETILLHARQSHHAQALHLLVHSLGDFDTATRYTLHSGRRVFLPSPVGAAPPPPSTLLPLLLDEYLSLSSAPQRLALSAELLDRFGAAFDIATVLAKVPPDWPVAVMRGFLDSALRGLVSERRETGVLKALAAGQNLRVAVERVERLEDGKGVVVEKEGGEGRSWGDSGYGSVGTMGSV